MCTRCHREARHYQDTLPSPALALRMRMCNEVELQIPNMNVKLQEGLHLLQGLSW